MTKKKVGKTKKRINQTAHQRAMKIPEVQETLNALRARWNDLSPQQRGEQLNVLIGFKCSEDGIAKELGKPATSIRRYIKEAGGDWFSIMERTWAEDPQEESTMCTGNVACRFPPKIPAKKIVSPVKNETCPAQDHAHTSTAEQTKKNTSPVSTKVKEPLVVNGPVSRQEDQVRGATPKTSLVDAYMNSEQIRANNIQRLAAISEQIKPRPIPNARSMKRQGKPEPPTDPQQSVS
jgi:hypothetical protein